MVGKLTIYPSTDRHSTEFEKMVSNERYNHGDYRIVLRIACSYLLCNRLNKSSTLRQSKNKILMQLFGSIDGAPYYVATGIP